MSLRWEPAASLYKNSAPLLQDRALTKAVRWRAYTEAYTHARSEDNEGLGNRRGGGSRHEAGEEAGGRTGPGGQGASPVRALRCQAGLHEHSQQAEIAA